jgi:hypothetical protein
MTKREIKKNIQSWYEHAIWYGYVNTSVGRLTDYQVESKAKEIGITLIYINCQ